MGRMTEPQHYELLSSILKHRPLSRPTLCVLEGTSDKQELLPAIEQYPGDPTSPNPPTPQPAPTSIKLEETTTTCSSEKIPYENLEKENQARNREERDHRRS